MHQVHSERQRGGSGRHPRRPVSLSGEYSTGSSFVSWWKVTRQQTRHKKKKGCESCTCTKSNVFVLAHKFSRFLFCNRKTNSQPRSSPNYHRGSKRNQNNTTPPGSRVKAAGFSRTSFPVPPDAPAGTRASKLTSQGCWCLYTPGVNKLQDLYKSSWVCLRGAGETGRVTAILVPAQLLVPNTRVGVALSAALKWSRRSSATGRRGEGSRESC